MSSPAELALLTRVLPLAIGAALSPMVLVVQLLNLSASDRAMARSSLFLLGCGLVVLMWLLWAGWIASLLPLTRQGPDPIAAAFDAAFAIVLLAVGIRILLQPPLRAPQQPARPGLLTAFLSGIALMGCNLTSLVLFLPAIQDFTRAGLRGEAWWSLALLMAAVTLLPAWLPPGLVLVMGRRGPAVLQTLSDWVVPRQRFINAGVTILLAVFLGMRAALTA